MKIAIIGAGFSGLSTAFFLSQEKSVEIDVFYTNKNTECASRVSAGLMHPYIGKSAKRSLFATEGMQKTMHLIDVAERELGEKVADTSGVFRIALTEDVKQTLDGYTQEYMDIEKVDPKTVPFLQVEVHGAYFIKNGVTIFPEKYLNGLLKVCKKRGVKFVERKITDIAELTQYDQILVATGAQIQQVLPEINLPIKFMKGQVLRCKLPGGITLKHSIVGSGYMAVSVDPKYCYLGSTYERDVTSKIDMELAKSLIFEKVEGYLTLPTGLEVTDCFMGVRALRKGHYLPLIGKVDNIWFITAMGSRGLLYHGLVGEIVSNAILHDADVKIPKQMRWVP